MAIKPSDDYNKCIQKYYTIVICEAICKVCLIKIAFKKYIYNGEREKKALNYIRCYYGYKNPVWRNICIIVKTDNCHAIHNSFTCGTAEVEGGKCIL